MKAKHARQIRKGIITARNLATFPWEHRRNLYRLFMRTATYLEWKSFDTYRQRHWTD